MWWIVLMVCKIGVDNSCTPVVRGDQPAGTTYEICMANAANDPFLRDDNALIGGVRYKFYPTNCVEAPSKEEARKKALLGK